jgi:hypothetical protein
MPTSRTRARLPPRSLAGIVALLVTLATVAAMAPPSLAGVPVRPTQQVPGGVEVASASLTSVRPGVATRDDVLVMTGVLTNTSEADLVDPLPALRWSSDPLQTVGEVDLVTTNPLFRYGRVDYRYSEPLETLGPGEQSTFRVDVPLDQLGLSGGVYVIGVDVLATLPDGLRVFVASARTTVPVEVDVADPLPVALLWPLAAAPSLLPDGSLTDDLLAEQIAAGGRLDVLLDAAASAPVTWVVDPDLVSTAAEMVGGYTTAASGAPGSGSADAARFLAEMSSVLAQGRDVTQVVAADPDVGGAQAAGVDQDSLAASLRAGRVQPAVSQVVGRPVPTLALLVGRPVTDDMVRSYLDAEVPTVVLDAAALTSPDSDGRATLGLTPPPLADTVIARVPPTTLPDASGSAVATAQWLVAVTAVQASSAAPPAAMVIAPSMRWDPDPAAARALVDSWQGSSWIEAVGLADVKPTDQVVELRSDQQPMAVPSETVTDLEALAADVERLQPLVPEPLLAPADLPLASARATSFAWQEQPARGADYVASLTSVVTAAERQISLVLSPSITLSSRSGRFPITLVNDAPVDVVVGVQFTSQNSTRLRVEDVEPTVLRAGEKRTVTATALATANGRLPVTATLVTTQGERVGASVQTIVDVTNVGALGWTVIALGGALMGVAVVRTRRRASREPGDTP